MLRAVPIVMLIAGIGVGNFAVAESQWKECSVTEAERFVFLQVPGQLLQQTFGICRGEELRPRRGVRAPPVCVHGCPAREEPYFEPEIFLEKITDQSVTVRVEGRIIDPKNGRNTAISESLTVPVGEERELKLEVGPVRVRYKHAG